MAKRPPDDLFESTSMSFGEHLEELRSVLIRALLGLMIGFGIGLYFAKNVVDTIQGPLKSSLDTYYLDKAKSDLMADYASRGELAPSDELEIIKERGLIQDMMSVDPAGVLACLKVIDPERFGEIEYGEHRFWPTDFREQQESVLCARLRTDGQAETSTPGKRVWQLLSAEQRQVVERVADQTNPGDSDRKQLVSVLNALVDQPALHESEEFAEVLISPAVPITWWKPWTWFRDTELDDARTTTLKNMRERVRITSDPELSRRLNKLLLAEAFPASIARPQKHLVQLPVWKPTDIRVQALGVHEAFMIWMKAGFVSGLVIASPWMFYQVWSFIAAGLYPHEKRYVHVFLPISLGLFLGGVALAFLFVFQPVLDFLFGFNKIMGIDPDPRISEWLGFVLFLPLGFGVSFQLPLVMLFVNRLGLVSIKAYVDKWRISVLLIFVISMVLTPADPVSMLLMACPLTVLYFLGIGMCQWMPHFRNPYAED